DAQFLALETPRQSGHVSGVAILDPSTAPGGKLELADIQRLLSERLPLLPPMRQRLAEVPLGLDYPYWIEDQDFDLDFHVRELAPGASREPGEVEMLARGLMGLPRYPLRALRSIPAAVPNLEDTPFSTLPGAGTVGRLASRVQRAVRGGPAVVRPSLTAPRTSFNGRVSPHRRFAFGQLPLDTVKAVKNEYSCTVNDVIVSICAGAVRRWLVEHHELPEEPLVAQIPVSVRAPDQAGTFGNRIMLMSAPLFTGVADPVEALRLP